MIRHNLSAEEIHGVDKIRKKLQGKIPADLDTDFNLVRWWRGYHGDISALSERFSTYIESRTAAGFDSPNFTEKLFDLPVIKPYMPYFSSSQLYDTAWSDCLGVFVFVEKAPVQPFEFVKVMKSSDFLLRAFGYSEQLLQLILVILGREKRLNRPVQVIVIFDLGPARIVDYLNPFSDFLKLWKLRSELWQDWYPEIVQKIILVNPPRLIGLIWGLTKLFLDENNRKLLHLAEQHSQILRHLDSSLVPMAYGGELAKKPNKAIDDSCCTKEKKITSNDYYQPGKHYELYLSCNRPTRIRADILAGYSLSVPVKVSAGQSLLWDFTTTSELEFSIRFEPTGLLVFPKLHLITGVVPEEGVLKTPSIGDYVFEFFNPNHYFNIVLNYAIVAVS